MHLATVSNFSPFVQASSQRVKRSSRQEVAALRGNPGLDVNGW